MFSSPVGDHTGNLESACAGQRTASPTQLKPGCPRQAELVICDKTIEAPFCRLKDFRRIATRYDKLARNYASAVALAAVITFWC